MARRSDSGCTADYRADGPGTMVQVEVQWAGVPGCAVAGAWWSIPGLFIDLGRYRRIHLIFESVLLNQLSVRGDMYEMMRIARPRKPSLLLKILVNQIELCVKASTQ